MQRKLLFILLVCCGLTKGVSAQDTYERFCLVSNSGRVPLNSTGKLQIGLDYGKGGNYSSFSDSLLVERLEKVRHCKSDAEILNYMTTIGWAIQSIYSGGVNNNTSIFVFKKTFSKSAVRLNENF